MFSDTGKREKKVNGSNSMLPVEKGKQNLVMHPEEYKLPLVWIDMEMTGKYVLFDHLH